MKKNQYGFSAIIVILVIIVIGLLVVTAAVVSRGRKPAPTTTNTPSPSPNPTTSQKPGTPPPSNEKSSLSNSDIANIVAPPATATTSPKLSNNSLPINEWGVSLRTTVDLGVVSYKYVAAGDQVNLNSDLQKKLPASCVYAKQSGWGVQRVAAGTATDAQKAGARLKGNYYFKFVQPPSTCSEAAADMQKLDDNYKAMFNTL